MKPLEGIRVLDLSAWAFCPGAGAVLASWGADVIHIESPTSPDPMRVSHGGSMEPGLSNWLFRRYNRGKRAITLDLANPRGRDVLHALARDADVFLTSFLPKTRWKLGVDVDDIRAINPSIVYAKGSGTGPLGPESGRGGYDYVTWWSRGSLAASAMAVTGSSQPPHMIGHGDGMSGVVLAAGICAALVHKSRTGIGTVVDASLLGSAMWFNAPTITSSQFAPERRLFYSKAERATVHWASNIYRTSDDRYLLLLFMGDRDDHFRDLCDHLDRGDLKSDPRFVDAAARTKHTAELVAALDEIFGRSDLATWKQVMRSTLGVWGPIQTPEELHTDPQVIANSFIQDVSYPDGALHLVASPVQFDGVAGDVARAPDFNEHTDAVLAEAGLDEAVIAKLRSEGVIA
jgi:crotonobetainyl-CoA:carnitine CoA-transferase CaiB-like acyl-CoA transferase